MITNSYLESTYKIACEIERSDKAFRVIHKSNQRINFDNDYVFYIAKGNVAAYAFDEELLLYNIFAPEVVGMEKIEGFTSINFFRCLTDVELCVIDKNDFKDIVDQYDLWQDSFNVVTSFYRVCHSRMNKICQPTAKGKIIAFVKYIWTLPPERRENTSIYTFIHLRTHISRSLIYKVLLELTHEGVIVVERGILMKCFL